MARANTTVKCLDHLKPNPELPVFRGYRPEPDLRRLERVVDQSMKRHAEQMELVRRYIRGLGPEVAEAGVRNLTRQIAERRRRRMRMRQSLAAMGRAKTESLRLREIHMKRVREARRLEGRRKHGGRGRRSWR